MEKKYCGDYGGENDDGSKCKKPSGWGSDGDERCKHHPYEDDETFEKYDVIDVIKGIKSNHIKPDQLTREQRRACLPILYYDQGKVYEELANIFEVSLGTIHNDFEALRKEDAEKVLQIKDSELGGELLRSMKRDVAKLREQGNYQKANSVLRNTIETLQELGLVRKEPDRHKISWLDAVEESLPDQDA